MFQKATNTRVTFFFHFSQASFSHFLSLKRVLKKVWWRNWEDSLEKSYKS